MTIGKLTGRFIALLMCFMLCMGIVVVPAETGKAAGGTYRALLVACSDSKLGQGPYNDLMMMRLALINMGVPAANIKVISNEAGKNNGQHQPNYSAPSLKKADVKSWMGQAYNGSVAGDTNIFFYSGHGNNNNNGTSYAGTNIVLGDYYPTEELATDMASYAGRSVVLLDCCNSGGIISKSAAANEALQEEMADDIETAIEDVQAKAAGNRPDFFVITAASSREESLGSTLGMLTTALASGMGVTYNRGANETLDTPYFASAANSSNSAMADQNRDNKITLDELFDHVYRETTGSVPTVYPQRSGEVLFTYSKIQPAHVANMQLSGPNASYQLSGTFEYYGPGTPAAYAAGHSVIVRGNSLLSYSGSRAMSLSSLGGNKYSFSVSGLDALYNAVIEPRVGDAVVTYGFKVDIRNSTSTSPVYRKPFTITSSASAPTIYFKETTPQPTRLLDGGQEYRLQIAYNTDAYVDVYIMDINGDKVRTLAENSPTLMKFPNNSNPSREMDFYWDGRDDNGVFTGGEGFYARAVARNNKGTSPVVVDSRLSAIKVGGTPTGIAINKSYSVGTGGSVAIKLAGTPSNAYTGATWVSSNPAIATVSEGGKVTGVAEGQVTITATSKENSALKAQTTVNVFKTGWQQNADGTYSYIKLDGQKADNWYQAGSTWYYFKNTIMQTGWQKIGSWYYLHEDGSMATGWEKIGNTWYYLKGSGAMATGWEKIGSTWYYMKGSGAMATGWQYLGGKWYYLKGSGAMATGWEKIGSTWYYFSGSGAMQTGWKQIGGKWYYFYASGAMAANTTIDGKYKLGASGAML